MKDINADTIIEDDESNNIFYLKNKNNNKHILSYEELEKLSF